jgi:hypothetical protein
MPIVVDNQAIAVPANFRNYGPFNINDNLSGIRISIERCTSDRPALWSDEDSEISVQISQRFGDAGPWIRLGGATFLGGLRLSRGEEVRQSQVQLPFKHRCSVCQNLFGAGQIEAGSHVQAHGHMPVATLPANRKIRARVCTVSGGDFESFVTVETV